MRRLAPLAEGRWRPPTTGLITGLYGYRIPLAFHLVGTRDGVRVQLGTWSAKSETAGTVQDRRRDVMASVLQSLYSAVDLEEVSAESSSWPLSGLALGVPAPAGLDETDGSAPIDRVVRSLVGTSWAVLVLAYPVAESAVAAVRAQVLNEMRTTGTAAKSEGAPSPMAEQYLELLKLTLASLGEGLATGAWRTAIYLLGDGETYPRLASAWRSVFSGERSLPEPVRVFDRPEVDALAQGWSLPDREGVPGPSQYRRPFEFQTLLTSAQLSMCVHLPELESPGFSVHVMPRFDTVPTKVPPDGALTVGRILQFGRDNGSEYRVAASHLTRHTFVAGVTGAGKTNTILGLLTNADAAGVSFLVIEPAKREYRSLIDHPAIGGRVRVFTAGQATVSPLTLNPFEVPPGTPVSTHIDLLRAVFSGAFVLWGPLPQILERCLHDVYVDRGWDLRTNTNTRVASPEDAADAFPTLTDLVAKVTQVVPNLGYETVGDLLGALVTRLDSLRTGAKGSMLDVSRSLPWDALLSQPTVIELEGMGDEGDKAFLAGLLLIRLAEYRRAQGPVQGLVHLLVIEEAHRLLGNVASVVSENVANPRAHAVETFSNLLSEIRAYGQGVVIADQVPARLAPDVMKNTNLKIAHRIVATDDRQAMAGTMAMDEQQAKALTALVTGQAVVFSSGDDAPLVVQVPPARGVVPTQPPDDGRVRDHMEKRTASDFGEVALLPRPFCAVTCRGAPTACEVARALCADGQVQQTLGRIVLSTLEEAGALDRLWDDLVTVLRARQPPGVDERELLRAFAGHGADWFAGRRGAQGGWSYPDTADFREQLQAVLLDKAEGQGAPGFEELRSSLQALAERLHARRFDPYPVCSSVCTQSAQVCMYRSAVADLVATGRYTETWKQADRDDEQAGEGRPVQTWSLLQDAAFELIEFPSSDEPEETRVQMEDGFRRVALCFEQQMLAGGAGKPPMAARKKLALLLDEVGLAASTGVTEAGNGSIREESE